MIKYNYEILEKSLETIKNGHFYKGCFEFERELEKVPKTYWQKYFFPAKLNEETVRVSNLNFDITGHLSCDIRPINQKGAKKRVYFQTERRFAETIAENILGAIRSSELKRKQEKEKK